MKAIAIARGFLVPSGRDLVCVPAFTRIQINGEERTGLRLLIGSRMV
jgi:stage V sporulation protein S